jgi:F0F1-type ATP synthase assembly protein I
VKTSPKQTQSMLRYASLATQLMVMLLVAVWLGYKVDGWLNWRIPVCMILFPLTALIVSLWKLVKDLSNQKK